MPIREIKQTDVKQVAGLPVDLKELETGMIKALKGEGHGDILGVRSHTIYVNDEPTNLRDLALLFNPNLVRGEIARKLMELSDGGIIQHHSRGRLLHANTPLTQQIADETADAIYAHLQYARMLQHLEELGLPALKAVIQNTAVKNALLAHWLTHDAPTVAQLNTLRDSLAAIDLTNVNADHGIRTALRGCFEIAITPVSFAAVKPALIGQAAYAHFLSWNEALLNNNPILRTIIVHLKDELSTLWQSKGFPNQAKWMAFWGTLATLPDGSAGNVKTAIHTFFGFDDAHALDAKLDALPAPATAAPGLASSFNALRAEARYNKLLDDLNAKLGQPLAGYMEDIFEANHGQIRNSLIRQWKVPHSQYPNDAAMESFSIRLRDNLAIAGTVDSIRNAISAAFISIGRVVLPHLGSPTIEDDSTAASNKDLLSAARYAKFMADLEKHLGQPFFEHLQQVLEANDDQIKNLLLGHWRDNPLGTLDTAVLAKHLRDHLAVIDNHSANIRTAIYDAFNQPRVGLGAVVTLPSLAAPVINDFFRHPTNDNLLSAAIYAKFIADLQEKLSFPLFTRMLALVEADAIKTNLIDYWKKAAYSDDPDFLVSLCDALRDNLSADPALGPAAIRTAIQAAFTKVELGGVVTEARLADPVVSNISANNQPLLAAARYEKFFFTLKEEVGEVFFAAIRPYLENPRIWTGLVESNVLPLVPDQFKILAEQLRVQIAAATNVAGLRAALIEAFSAAKPDIRAVITVNETVVPDPLTGGVFDPPELKLVGSARFQQFYDHLEKTQGKDFSKALKPYLYDCDAVKDVLVNHWGSTSLPDEAHLQMLCKALYINIARATSVASLQSALYNAFRDTVGVNIPVAHLPIGESPTFTALDKEDKGLIDEARCLDFFAQLKEKLGPEFFAAIKGYFNEDVEIELIRHWVATNAYPMLDAQLTALGNELRTRIAGATTEAQLQLALHNAFLVADAGGIDISGEYFAVDPSLVDHYKTAIGEARYAKFMLDFKTNAGPTSTLNLLMEPVLAGLHNQLVTAWKPPHAYPVGDAKGLISTLKRNLLVVPADDAPLFQNTVATALTAFDPALLVAPDLARIIPSPTLIARLQGEQRYIELLKAVQEGPVHSLLSQTNVKEDVITHLSYAGPTLVEANSKFKEVLAAVPAMHAELAVLPEAAAAPTVTNQVIMDAVNRAITGKRADHSPMDNVLGRATILSLSAPRPGAGAAPPPPPLGSRPPVSPTATADAKDLNAHRASSCYYSLLAAIHNPILSALLRDDAIQGVIVEHWKGSRTPLATILSRIPEMQKALSVATTGADLLAALNCVIVGSRDLAHAVLTGRNTGVNSSGPFPAGYCANARYDLLFTTLNNPEIRAILECTALQRALIKRFDTLSLEDFNAVMDRIPAFRRELVNLTGSLTEQALQDALSHLMGGAPLTVAETGFTPTTLIDVSQHKAAAFYDTFLAAIKNPELLSMLTLPAVQKALINDWKANGFEGVLERLPGLYNLGNTVDTALTALNRVVSGVRADRTPNRAVVTSTDLGFVPKTIQDQRMDNLTGGSRYDQFWSKVNHPGIRALLEKPEIKNELIRRWKTIAPNDFKAVQAKVFSMVEELSRLGHGANNTQVLNIINRTISPGSPLLTLANTGLVGANTADSSYRSDARYARLYTFLTPELKKLSERPEVQAAIAARLGSYTFTQFCDMINRIPQMRKDLSLLLPTATYGDIFAILNKALGGTPDIWTHTTTGLNASLSATSDLRQSIIGESRYYQFLVALHNRVLRSYFDGPAATTLIKRWGADGFTSNDFTAVMERIPNLHAKIEQLPTGPIQHSVITGLLNEVFGSPNVLTPPRGTNDTLKPAHYYDRLIMANRHNASIRAIIGRGEVIEKIISHLNLNSNSLPAKQLMEARISAFQDALIEAKTYADVRNALNKLVDVGTTRTVPGLLDAALAADGVLQDDELSLEHLDIIKRDARYAKLIASVGNNPALLDLMTAPAVQQKLKQHFGDTTPFPSAADLQILQTTFCGLGATSTNANVIAELNSAMGGADIAIADVPVPPPGGTYTNTGRELVNPQRAGARYAALLADPVIKNNAELRKIFENITLQRKLLTHFETNPLLPASLDALQDQLKDVTSAEQVKGVLNSIFVDLDLNDADLITMGLATRPVPTGPLRSEHKRFDALGKALVADVKLKTDLGAIENKVLREVFIAQGVKPTTDISELNKWCREHKDLDAGITDAKLNSYLPPEHQVIDIPKAAAIAIDQKQVNATYRGLVTGTTDLKDDLKNVNELKITTSTNQFLRRLLLHKGLRLKDTALPAALKKLREADYSILTYTGVAPTESFIRDYLLPVIDPASLGTMVAAPEARLSEIFTIDDFRRLKTHALVAKADVQTVGTILSDSKFILTEAQKGLPDLSKNLKLEEDKFRDLGGAHRSLSKMIDLDAVKGMQQQTRQTLQDLKAKLEESKEQLESLKALHDDFKGCIIWGNYDKASIQLQLIERLPGISVDDQRVNTIYKLLELEKGKTGEKGKLTERIGLIDEQIVKINKQLNTCDEIDKHIQREADFKAGVAPVEFAAYGTARTKIHSLGGAVDVKSLGIEVDKSKAAGMVSRLPDGEVRGARRTGTVQELQNGQQYETYNQVDGSFYVTSCKNDTLKIEAYLDSKGKKDYNDYDNLLKNDMTSQFLLNYNIRRAFGEKTELKTLLDATIFNEFKDRPMTKENLTSFLSEKNVKNPKSASFQHEVKKLIAAFDESRTKEYPISEKRGAKTVRLAKEAETAINMVEELKAKTYGRIYIGGTDEHFVKFMVLFCIAKGYEFTLAPGQGFSPAIVKLSNMQDTPDQLDKQTQNELNAVRYYAKDLLRNAQVTPEGEVKQRVDETKQHIAAHTGLGPKPTTRELEKELEKGAFRPKR